jgi:hypothetical protein
MKHLLRFIDDAASALPAILLFGALIAAPNNFWVS